MISTITIEEQDKWDNIVKSFKNYDVNYLSQYAKAFAENGEGYPVLIYFENDTSKAMNVVMKRDISLSENFKGKLPPNEWFDLSTPYGYGGFWIEGEDFNTLDEEYEQYCKNNGFISEFVRFHLFGEYRDIFNGTVESHTNNVVRSLDLDIDDMLMDFEHKVRKNLKKANKAGLKIEIDESGKRIEEFLNIYYGTMDRNEAKSNFFFPESFFKTINKMINNFVYVHVIHEDRVISTELVIFGGENCYSFLGGTHSDFFSLRPNDFLKFEIIKWAKDKGLKRFILGGGYGQDDGIFRYKKSFSPNGIHKFYVGKRIFDEEKYSELIKIRSCNQDFNKDTNFFPKYRA
ncbi:GNAT family N-acetyltransferase [Fusibacter paucivorans]|uniref:GNAT family N-acetyltransferase n=1 Tax=Fusibacter paucivorans TaxID=76009 RepID=A0ABS5PU65_9FIRM|nr:GNAT family N-acetyltransferase [Fusibacter paucivorans]MBS7528106.1 GNAT family N-acetyltransferase [Fusibacter paucivorans]